MGKGTTQQSQKEISKTSKLKEKVIATEDFSLELKTKETDTYSRLHPNASFLTI